MDRLLPDDRILVLDGAMGTMLQRHGLTGPGQVYNLTSPEVVASIHREYIDAGADIIETNTFSGGYETSLAGARIARSVADAASRKIIVAGSVGPTTKSLSICSDYDHPDARALSFDAMADAYSGQIRGLLDGGVDVLLLETCFDALNAKAAICVWNTEGRKVPVIVSGTFSDASGRLLTGQTLEAFYTSILHCGPAAFGLNCGLGAEKMLPLVQELGGFAACPVICYPNAGLPDGRGNYTQTPSEMAAEVGKLADTGIVSIVGGCCGTTPDHIRAIAEKVKGVRPSVRPSAGDFMRLSGLEAFRFEGGELPVCAVTNSELNPQFAEMIAGGDYDSAMCLASEALCSGLDILNINMDAVGPGSGEAMGKFVRYIMMDPSVSRAALMIESSDAEVLAEGLKNAQGRCLACCHGHCDREYFENAFGAVVTDADSVRKII